MTPPDILWHDKCTEDVTFPGRAWFLTMHLGLQLSFTAQVWPHPAIVSLQTAGKNNMVMSGQQHKHKQHNTVFRMFPGPHRLHHQKGALPTCLPQRRNTNHNRLTSPITIRSQRDLAHISQVTERSLTILWRWSKQESWLMTFSVQIPGLRIFPICPSLTTHGRPPLHIHNLMLRYLSPVFSYLESSSGKSMNTINEADESLRTVCRTLVAPAYKSEHVIRTSCMVYCRTLV